jgi:hypothetical protein
MRIAILSKPPRSPESLRNLRLRLPQRLEYTVIPGENASPARTEGSRCETLKVTSSGSFGPFDCAQGRHSLCFAQDDTLINVMKKVFCVLSLSICFFACQKRQGGYQLLAQIQLNLPAPAEQPGEIESKSAPATKATTPNAAESTTPQSKARVIPTATETSILSLTAKPTPAISSTPESTAQTAEAGKKPVATSTPRLRLNPLLTGTPLPAASASAEFNSPASSVAPTVPAETRLQGQKTANPGASTSATASWIRSASGKKRATPSVAASSSP